MNINKLFLLIWFIYYITETPLKTILEDISTQLMVFSGVYLEVFTSREVNEKMRFLCIFFQIIIIQFINFSELFEQENAVLFLIFFIISHLILSTFWRLLRYIHDRMMHAIIYLKFTYTHTHTHISNASLFVPRNVWAPWAPGQVIWPPIFYTILIYVLLEL